MEQSQEKIPEKLRTCLETYEDQLRIIDEMYSDETIDPSTISIGPRLEDLLKGLNHQYGETTIRELTGYKIYIINTLSSLVNNANKGDIEEVKRRLNEERETVRVRLR